MKVIQIFESKLNALLKGQAQCKVKFPSLRLAVHNSHYVNTLSDWLTLRKLFGACQERNERRRSDIGIRKIPHTQKMHSYPAKSVHSCKESFKFRAIFYFLLYSYRK